MSIVRKAGNVMGIPLKKIARRWMTEPGFKAGYDALEEEFSEAFVPRIGSPPRSMS